MSEQRRKLSARAILSDMKSGLSDEQIMKKHGLRPDQFARIYDKLVEVKLIRPGRSQSSPGTAAGKSSPARRPTPGRARASGTSHRRPETPDEEVQSSPDSTEITRSLFGPKAATVHQGVLFAAIVKPGISISPDSIGAAEGIAYFHTDDQGLNLWGIDLDQCETKWRFQVGDWLETPVCEHWGYLYFATARRLYCVNGESGEPRWITDCGVLPSSDWIMGEGVCLHLGTDGALTALNLDTGKRRWTSTLEEAVPGSVSLMDGGLCVTCRDGRLYGLDMLSGERKWLFHIGEVTNPTSTVHGGFIYTANDDGYLYTLDSGTGDVLWRFDSGYGIVAKPVVGAGMVCVAGGDQALYGLDSTAGRQLWRLQLQAALGTSGLIGKGILCAWTTRGDLIALDVRNGQTKWNRMMGPKASADPSLLNGNLLVCEREVVHALDMMSGQESWRLELPERVDTSPLFSSGVFLIKVGQRMLYTVDARGPGEDRDPRLLIRIESEPQPKRDLMLRKQEQARQATEAKARLEESRPTSAPYAIGRVSSRRALKIISVIIGFIGLVLTFAWITAWGNLSLMKVIAFVCSGFVVMGAAGVLYWLGNRFRMRQ